MLFLLSLSMICALAMAFIIYYSVPILVKRQKLGRDYQNILSLPLSRIPLVGNLHQFDKRQHVFSRLLLDMAAECQQQGKGLFCLWYSLWPMIFACTGESLATFINNSKQLVKSFDYTLLEPWLKTGLLTSNKAKWRSRRRLITPSFHDSQLLNNFMLIFNEQSQVFAGRLDESIRSGQGEQTLDLFPYISTCTLDIIAGSWHRTDRDFILFSNDILETAMGEHVGAQLSNGTNEFVEATGRMGSIIGQRVRSPWLWPTFIFNRSPLGREQAKRLNILHSVSRKIIERRLNAFNADTSTSDDVKKSTRRLVFLDSLLAQMKTEQLSLDDIQEEVDTFMFEGHDTTAAAVNFTSYLIASHSDVQAKIHAELDTIFGDDKERPCTLDDVQEMTYLDLVVKESMRVLPPVPLVSREAQEDFICDGQTIRKGTTLQIFIIGVHYDSNVFPQPEQFDPDRFSKSSSINEDRSPYAFIPFSAGSRNCVGQRFALLEEKVILSTLFRRFSFRATQTVDELQLSFEAIMRPGVPIQLIIEQRQRQ